jgi:threonine dehydratase
VNNIAAPSRDDIEAAAQRIERHVRRTPMLGIGLAFGASDVTLKLDLLQPTGSFKVRGAFNCLLGADPRPKRVVAASGGNFGLAIAYAARRLGVAADIFVPATSPDAKIHRLRDEGAEVHVIDGYYADALVASEAFVGGTDALFAHAYDQMDVVAGQGTCGLEMAQDAPDADVVLVAVGGGGLIGGIASWFRGETRVIGVETEHTPTLHSARAAGGPIDIEVGGLAADSLGSRRLGNIAWAANEWVEDVLLVTDDAVRDAQRLLWNNSRLIAEPGAATTIAALASGVYQPQAGERVIALVCGANTDPAAAVG